jgi:hypothetical protein
MIKPPPTKSQLQRANTSTRALATTANSVPAQARPCAQTLKPTRCFKRFKLQEATPLRPAKANGPLLKPTCDQPTLHKCSMTTSISVTRKEPGHYCYKTTGIQKRLQILHLSQHNTMTHTKILVQKLRSTSCEQCLDRFHRTLPWRSTSAGRC